MKRLSGFTSFCRLGNTRLFLGIFVMQLMCLTPGHAAWEETHRWVGATAYLDPQLTRREGDRVQFIELIDYTVPKKSRQDLLYRSLIVVTQLDCKLRRSREVVYQFSRAKGQGDGRLQLQVADSELMRFASISSIDMDAIYTSHQQSVGSRKPPAKTASQEKTSVFGTMFGSFAAPLGAPAPIGPVISGTAVGQAFDSTTISGGSIENRPSNTSRRAARSTTGDGLILGSGISSDPNVDSLDVAYEAMGWRAQEFMSHRFRVMACPNLKPVSWTDDLAK